MRCQSGDTVPFFELPALEDVQWHPSSVKGRPYLLSFFRFASCPFCNLRLHQLIEARKDLPDAFTVVAVFESSLENLQRYANRHESPFAILADDGGIVHKQFGVSQSWAGALKAMVLRLPTAMRAMFVKGYYPLTLDGKLTTLPADFLVDGHGVIREAHYGSDAGDHLDLARVKNFALQQVPAVSTR